MDIYKQKYIKYKTKYLNLKRHQGLQIGGKLFDKQQTLYIVATISDPKLKRVAKKITDTIIAKNVKPYRDPHITLFNLTINALNPDSIIFQDPKFYNKIRKVYDKTIGNPEDPLILESYEYPKGFSLSGYRPRHFLKYYRQLNPDKIFDFRDMIYGLLEKRLGRGKATVKDDINITTGAKYHIVSFGKKELFAESLYFDNWKPHLNFLNDFDIDKNNEGLAEDLTRVKSGKEKTDIVLGEIDSINQNVLEYIDMSEQMDNLTYALSQGRKKLVTVYL
jgi:hypothetical protein